MINVKIKLLPGDEFDRPALMFFIGDRSYVATRGRSIDQVIAFFEKELKNEA